MSSFDTLESSVEDSVPIEIYTFTNGSDFFRYTSAEDDISLDGNTYEAIAISRSKIAKTAEDRNRDFTIEMPSGNEFVAKYIVTPPGQAYDTEITRLQRDESPVYNTRIQVFNGQVLSCRFTNSGHAAEVVLRSADVRFNQSFPRRTYASMCSHTLFDDQCGVDPSTNNHIGTVTAVNSDASVLTVNGLNASSVDAVGGYCRPTGENDFRMILAQSGDDITLLLPFVNSPLNESLQVFAGCDRRLQGDCANTFDNVLEFGGWAFVPNRNPFTDGLESV